jgi:methylated-DNA-[protein]-cysteine S-methyltransferase
VTPTTRLVLESPIGRLTLAGDETHVTHLFLPNSGVASRGGTPGRPPEPLRRAAGQLREYFAGGRREFDVPLRFAGGTAFQQQVWLSLADIPYGETVSYAELAEAVGRPSAFRAVGQANGANPLPIFFPCHRVVASGGGLGGYGGGLGVKKKLLALEKETAA